MVISIFNVRKRITSQNFKSHKVSPDYKKKKVNKLIFDVVGTTAQFLVFWSYMAIPNLIFRKQFFMIMIGESKNLAPTSDMNCKTDLSFRRYRTLDTVSPVSLSLFAHLEQKL